MFDPAQAHSRPERSVLRGQGVEGLRGPGRRVSATRPGLRPGAVVPYRGLRLADALVHDHAVAEAVTDFATACVQDGEGLDVCLAELDDTYLAVRGEPAPALVVRRATLAWAETARQHSDELAGAGPTSSVNGIEHIRWQVAMLYHEAGEGWLAGAVDHLYALVVVELSADHPGIAPGFASLAQAVRLTTAVDMIQEWIPGCAQVARLHPGRLAAVARRTPSLDADLAGAVQALTQRLPGEPTAGDCRGWTERLPPTPELARDLLDELAR